LYAARRSRAQLESRSGTGGPGPDTLAPFTHRVLSGGTALTGSTEDGGRRQALDRFLAGVEQRAFRIALLSTRETEEALDAVQDAMLRLAQRYGERPEAEWPALFYRILQNRLRDAGRRRQVRQRYVQGQVAEDRPDPVMNHPGPEVQRPDRQVELADAGAALNGAVRVLPDRQREAFLFRAVEGYSVAETATLMGCSQGSVKTHLHRAVVALRSALEEHEHG
jgi:RNA polymerase sigma-70 factor, ECF subfamily